MRAMHNRELTKALTVRVMLWLIRGGQPVAEPLPFEEGWVLRISGRAKFACWIILLVFVLFLWLGLSVRGSVPEHEWIVTMAVFGGLAALGLYLAVSLHLYRVEVRPQTLSLRRFLIPLRETRWDEITAARCDVNVAELSFERREGRTLKISLTLNGLWTIRKPIAEKCQPPFETRSWVETEATLRELSPAWIEPVGEESSSASV